MLTTLGARCAGALERASLYERHREAALVLQRHLLPDVANDDPAMDVGASYRPAAGRRVGGDWFQLVGGEEGRLVAVVGDAVGHGLVSAAAMGQLRASIATAVASTADPVDALRIVDRFASQSPDTCGATAVVAVVDGSGHVRHASAGHPPMILVPRDAPARLVESGRGPLLGFDSGCPRSSGVERFRHGDAIVLYTDGLVERRGETIDVGLRRLLATVEDVRELGSQVMCDHILDAMEAAGFDDDVAILVVRARSREP